MAMGPDARSTEHGRSRALTVSTIGFALMFAVWLVFGVLGIEIRDEFGAYAALAAWVSTSYVDVFDLPPSQAMPLTALFVFPATLLRPVGGGLSAKPGARRVMPATFGTMLLAVGVLMMACGHIVVLDGDGAVGEVLPWQVGVVLFTGAVIVIGCAMGIGKAAVYKQHSEDFPNDAGAVGGLVGPLGVLGGLFLAPIFAYPTRWTGLPQSTFFVLFAVTLVAAVWIHVTVVNPLHAARPGPSNKFQHDQQIHTLGAAKAVPDAPQITASKRTAGATT